MFMLFYKNKDKLKKYELYSFSIISILYIVFFTLDTFCIFTNKFVSASLILLYYLESLILIIKYVDKPLKEHLIWYYGLFICYIGPLLIVYLIGPRLIMFPYILNIMIILELLNYFKLINKFKYIYIITTIIIISLHSYTYINAYSRALKLYDKINNKLENNEAKIVLKKSEEEPYYHFYIPWLSYYKKYYIEYYNINTDLTDYEIEFK